MRRPGTRRPPAGGVWSASVGDPPRATETGPWSCRRPPVRSRAPSRTGCGAGEGKHNETMARIRFHQYAWGLLAYNLCVVLGGAFVRASISGDGCGNHWPDCNGQLHSQPVHLKTLIEFSHRASTGLLLLADPGPGRLGVPGALRRATRCGRAPLLPSARLVAEALIGAGLVQFRLVAHDKSVYRAVVMPIAPGRPRSCC